MKKILVLFLFCALLFFSCKKLNPSVPAGDIKKTCPAGAIFPDPVLESAVKWALDIQNSGGVCEESLYAVNYLYIDGQVNDFTGLEKLTNLRSLTIYANTFSNLDFLSRVPELMGLQLQNCTLATTAGIETLTNLYQLTILNTPTGSFSGINALVNLENLSIGNAGMQDSDMSMLTGMSKLNNLYLSDNNITSLASISGLSNLAGIRADNCHITSLAPIAGLSQLRQASFNGNALANLTGVTGLANLNTLSAENNFITDISALTGLPSLFSIDLSGNSLTDVTALAAIASLVVMDLAYNSITSIYPVYSARQAGGLGSLQGIYLTGNPLNAAPDVDTYIPALEAAGIRIFY